MLFVDTEIPSCACRAVSLLSFHLVSLSLPNSRATAGRSFVPGHLGAPLAVVEVVGDADHARGRDVVGRRRLDGARAPQAAQHLDRDHRAATASGVHAVPRAGAARDLRGEIRVRSRVG